MWNWNSINILHDSVVAFGSAAAGRPIISLQTPEVDYIPHIYICYINSASCKCVFL